MLDTYHIQIFEVTPKLDKVFEKKFHLLIDTALVANFTDHKSILKKVINIFDKENIYKDDKQFLIYIGNFDNDNYRGGVKYLFTFDTNSVLTKVQIQRQYYQEFIE